MCIAFFVGAAVGLLALPLLRMSGPCGTIGTALVYALVFPAYIMSVIGALITEGLYGLHGGDPLPWWSLGLSYGLLAAFLAWLWPVRRRPRVNSPRCPKCDYSLIGNVSGRCPECGRKIEDSGGS